MNGLRTRIAPALLVIPLLAVAIGVRGEGVAASTGATSPTATVSPSPSAVAEQPWQAIPAAAPIGPAPTPPIADVRTPPSVPGVPSRPSVPVRPPAPAPAPPGTVPVLYYHRVQAPPAGFSSWSPSRKRAFLAYDVIPSALQAQLDWLVAHGYTTILPRDLAAHWDHGTPLPARPVILTFDDGFHDWVTTVLPMLRQRHMVAEFYLTLDAIKSRAISWADVRALGAAGNGIGAHDVHHVQLAGLGQHRPAATSAVMWAEISRIRRVIAQHIGTVPDSMAYVGGGFDARLEALVRRAGYTTARSIIRGIHQRRDGRFELRVVRIGAHDDVTDLMRGHLRLGLPTFTARIAGQSDLASRR